MHDSSTGHMATADAFSPSTSVVKRPASTYSAQSSQSVTPTYDGKDKIPGIFYLATPDLLSSDTDLNSPESLFPGSVSAMERNPSNDTIVAATDRPNGNGNIETSRMKNGEAGASETLGGCEAVTFGTIFGTKSELEMKDLRDQKDNVLPAGMSSGEDGAVRCIPDCQFERTSHCREYCSPAVLTADTSCNNNQSLPPAVLSDANLSSRVTMRPPSARVTSEPAPRKRDESPINRLADMFRNFPKF